MNLLVCISKTPETTAKIAFTGDGKVFDSQGVQFILNPYDEWYALVRAIELKEQLGGKVTVINVGDASNDIIIRKALAVGADEAVRINAEPRSAHFVAQQISEYARGKNFDIIMLGKETIDFNGSQLGGMVAQSLELPFISYCIDMKSDGTKMTLTRDIEGGGEVIEVNGAFVLSAAKGLAEQRLPKMKDIMASKRKPLDILEAVDCDERVTTVSFNLPEGKSGVKMVDPKNMDELVRLLNEEAKVI